ncbi:MULTISPECIES: 50S ribosomal protein L6 [Desulfosporosinus]|uniref:Large ribosomal subunit protein uL6 n=2 Tax=Desulfosporosinus TaxID=79206 RepID=A0A1M6CMQ5_9FIRM|nr:MULTISPECIES: 50S ribosomal protein L6 [Desulfosporosinus]MDA8220698.1 50S ribosomal protein L6 [Desulfitobacterium hafniense]MCB8815683.1 50S ribosomal protein L6 [Desulfosporosinus sp. SRJS8]MCO1602666.1 50S ribosomal protein L6 [Desulfosporosinus nitroreducens]MCO5388162.1 50S ribosomal protein L6 [Desulfosporosinus sp.]MDO0823627.1 50S ribosomal protein L6 [Desulfosporosinus nitroreducens]
MSRIGKRPIGIPSGVDFKIESNVVTVKGPKGTLTREIHSLMNIAVEDSQIIVTRPDDQPLSRSLHGLTRTLIANMVEGVTNGFTKGLDMVGVGYRAAKQGNKLVLTVGKSHPVELTPFEGIDFEVPAPNKILVKGMDKELVGAFAAVVRSERLPEPYKGKGIKYEGEVIRRKVGKTGGKKGAKK